MYKKTRHWPVSTNDSADAMERNNGAKPIHTPPRCVRLCASRAFLTSRPDTHFLLIRWITDSRRRSAIHKLGSFFLPFHDIFRPKKARLCSAPACPT